MEICFCAIVLCDNDGVNPLVHIVRLIHGLCVCLEHTHRLWGSLSTCKIRTSILRVCTFVLLTVCSGVICGAGVVHHPVAETGVLLPGELVVQNCPLLPFQTTARSLLSPLPPPSFLSFIPPSFLSFLLFPSFCYLTLSFYCPFSPFLPYSTNRVHCVETAISAISTEATEKGHKLVVYPDNLNISGSTMCMSVCVTDM